MAVSETHISVLLALGERMYKFKKPVSLAFVDLSTVAARRRTCEREVELNRRLSPDVYLGLASLVADDGEDGEPAVVMRRLPEERRLAALVANGTPVDDEIDRVASVLARFHREARRGADVDAAARRDAVTANWEANFEEMRPFLATEDEDNTVGEVEVLARRYLAGRSRLFDQRISDGHACDGHGDLLADDIFCLPDGPRILDCVEFDDRLRHGDVLADVAFLAMDLERLGRADLAERFLAGYRAKSEPWPDTLAHHYIAYRAQVRAKVAWLRAAECLADTGEDPAALLELCRRNLRLGQVVLVLVGGPPATGKSTLAQALAARLGWSLLRSDDVRGEVAAITGHEKGPAALGTGAYRPALTEATYRTLLARAREALELGRPVLVDASWADPPHRQAAVAVAEEASAVVVELRCVLDVNTAAARAAHRRPDDPSDATPELVRELAAGFAPWPGAVEIDASTDPDTMLDAALDVIAAQCGTQASGIDADIASRGAAP